MKFVEKKHTENQDRKHQTTNTKKKTRKVNKKTVEGKEKKQQDKYICMYLWSESIAGKKVSNVQQKFHELFVGSILQQKTTHLEYRN